MKLCNTVVFCGMVLSQPVVSGHACSSADTPTRPTNSKLQKTDSQLTPEELNRRALAAWSHEELQQSFQYFRQALEVERAAGSDSLATITTLNGLGDIAETYGDVTKAEEHYENALTMAQKLRLEGVDTANSLHGLGMVEYHRGDLQKAEALFQQALTICRRSPDGLATANNLDGLGMVSLRRWNLPKAEEFYHEALRIREKTAPGSLEIAISYNHLGSVAHYRNQFDKSWEFYQQAIAIEDSQTLSGLEFSKSLLGLSYVAFARNDLKQAETFLKESLEIQEKLIPGSLTEATTFSQLSFNARIRGLLQKAEEYERRALVIREKLVPNSLYLAASFNSLGNILARRGDLATAEHYQQRALEIRENLNPGSLELILSFWSMGALHSRRGDKQKAGEFYGKALTIAEKIDPDGLLVAACQSTLSALTLSDGDLDKAEQQQRHALEIQQKLTPGNGEVAQSLAQLGFIAERGGNLAKAEDYLRQAIAIREKLAPGTIQYTGLLEALARITRRAQKPEIAAQFYEQAITSLETQLTHLGGADEIRSDFRAMRTGYYKEYIDLLIEQTQPEHAFQVLERSRARSLLELLALANVDIQQGIDPSLLKQQQTLRELLAAKTSAQIQLLSHKHTREQLAAIKQEMEELLDQSHQVETQIEASPRYAELIHPQPLSTAQVQQQLLDHDTLLLEYSLEDKRSYVFVVSSALVTVHKLPGRAEIEKTARRVYDLLTTRNHIVKDETDIERRARLAKAELEYPKAAQELSEMVLGPLRSELGRKRLLIVSDGMLEYIPFAALPTPGSKAQAPLILTHEIINLPSASVLAVLRQQAVGRSPAPRAVAILADPVFDKNDVRVATTRRSDPETAKAKVEGANTRSWVESNGELHLPRLLFSRQEAQAIMAVTSRGESKQFLDFQANRSVATNTEMESYRTLHFATHGLLDSDHPELSGLVLSMVTKEGVPQNGFLGLQDIYNLKLRAELVVLSSCETGLGKQVNGEGLVGLTRGFMYAGASRIVASLWNVSDIATARLMASFYKAMEQQKVPPAAALRAAQIEMWKQSRWRSPHYWAAFQIQGEWR